MSVLDTIFVVIALALCGGTVVYCLLCAKLLMKRANQKYEASYDYRCAKSAIASEEELLQIRHSYRLDTGFRAEHYADLNSTFVRDQLLNYYRKDLINEARVQFQRECVDISRF